MKSYETKYCELCKKENNESPKTYVTFEMHLPPLLGISNGRLLLYTECPSIFRAGMPVDSWGSGQHTGPLNEKNDQLSPALLKTHLHPVRFYYGWGPAQELQDRTEPECTNRAGQAPISLTRLTGPVDG